MSKLGYRYCLVFILCLLVSLAHALTVEDAHLLQKEYQQYQAWVLGRNYFFGTTVKQDRIKALAWQMIYVEQLPASYPEKEKLLRFYKQGLSAGQKEDAKKLAALLRTRYDLLPPFNEDELYRVYTLHEEKISWRTLQPVLPPAKVWSNFNSWLDWLAKTNNPALAATLELRMHDLIAAKRFPIVYGQVIVKGPEPLMLINSGLDILPGGFFISHPGNNTVSFILPGYKSANFGSNTRYEIQAIPPIILEAEGGTKPTGVVGRVLPWGGVEQSNILLQRVMREGNASEDPWFRQAMPLTVTNGGEFYTTGLSPGRYELFINTAGLSTSKQFTVRDGEIRGLSLIDLRQKVAH
ncbi:hypothetical protein [Legionella tunisiensis]|uniref:hypothetical protein n=1 Tax=Legionella tunisiensis TaxID=1034944 RepID=UPI0002FE1F7C|nr:hypothetical protein [Legionella tunisiensis]